MGWSGGTFSRVHDWTDDETAGYNIEASRMDAEDDNFATGINACLHKAGQNTATGNLPMGGYIHTGVGDGTARNNYAAIGQVQDSDFIHATSSGTNTVTLTLSPAITAYAAGQMFTFVAGGSNTGAATLNVNSLGAKAIQASGSALTGYEILSGETYMVIYDGTYFQLLNPAYQVGAVAYRSTNQAISQNTATDIEFDNEDADSTANPIHDTSTNPERFTVTRTGVYICTAYAALDGDTDNRRAMSINVNGTSKYACYFADASIALGIANVAISGLVYMTAGQYVTFSFYSYDVSENITAARGGVHLLPAY